MQRAKKARGPTEVTEQEVEEAFGQCDDGSGFVGIKRLKVGVTMRQATKRRFR